jgi:hypothetical protein
MTGFIEDLLRPHVLDTSLDAGYKAMAADQVRESEAMDWVNALAGDVDTGKAVLRDSINATIGVDSLSEFSSGF